MHHLLLRSIRWASSAGGTFPRLILGIGIRASIPVNPTQESPPPPLLLLRRLGRIHFLQNQCQLSAAQFAGSFRLPQRFGFGVHYSHACTLISSVSLSSLRPLVKLT